MKELCDRIDQMDIAALAQAIRAETTFRKLLMQHTARPDVSDINDLWHASDQWLVLLVDTFIGDGGQLTEATDGEPAM